MKNIIIGLRGLLLKKELWQHNIKNKTSVLHKSDLYKPTANAVVNIDEIKLGAAILPPFLINWLTQELRPLNIGDKKTINLTEIWPQLISSATVMPSNAQYLPPFPKILNNNVVLQIQKDDADAYSGYIIKDNKIIAKLEKRSIPGIGLYLISALELYDYIMPANQVLGPVIDRQVVNNPTPPVIVNVNIQNDKNNTVQPVHKPRYLLYSLKEFLEKRKNNIKPK